MLRASATAIVVAALLGQADPALAALANQASVEELARTSDAVVRGRVLSIRSRAYKGRITTTADVEVAGVWRGAAPRTVKVRYSGGVADGFAQRVDGMAELRTGEDVVLFLTKSGKSYKVNGLAQGKFRVEGETVRPSLDDLQFVGSTTRKGERLTEAMPLAELERRVRDAR